MVHLPPEEGQFITCTSQTNYNTLIHSSPWLHWTRLRNSSTWRFVANCLLGRFVFHHFSRLTCRFFFPLPFSRILYSYSYPHFSLPSGCPFFSPSPAASEGSDTMALDIHLQFRMWPASDRSPLSTAPPEEGKAQLPSTGLVADIRFGWTHLSLLWVQQLSWPICAELHMEAAAFPDLWLQGC